MVRRRFPSGTTHISAGIISASGNVATRTVGRDRSQPKKTRPSWKKNGVSPHDANGRRRVRSYRSDLYVSHFPNHAWIGSTPNGRLRKIFEPATSRSPSPDEEQRFGSETAQIGKRRSKAESAQAPAQVENRGPDYKPMVNRRRCSHGQFQISTFETAQDQHSQSIDADRTSENPAPHETAQSSSREERSSLT